MRLFILPLCIAACTTSIACQASPVTNREITTRLPASLATKIVTTPTFTLEQAFAIAETANIALRQAQAQSAGVQGDAIDAGALLWNNPRLYGDAARRSVQQPDQSIDSRREGTIGLEQTFETAGQQGYRRQVSQAQGQALTASIEDTRREVRAEVEKRFVQVLSIQQRIDTERQSLEIIESTALSVGKRVAAGEDSRLDGNLAKVEAVRARNQIGLLNEQLIQARADLAGTLQMPLNQIPAVSGSLAAGPPEYTLEKLLASASQRPLLQSLDYREQAARNRVSLEKSARYPDVTVGLSTGREGPGAARERLTTVTLSMPLPLFRNNAGAIGRAVTDLTQVQLERQAATANASTGITAQWQKLQSLSARVEALQTTVLPALEENQRLSVKSLQAGEIGLFQLLVVNRQVLDGRRDLIDAQTELRLARVALHLAAGWINPALTR
jgi:cobalt-zinc-cadmium efflux system outer membrane protein